MKGANGIAKILTYENQDPKTSRSLSLNRGEPLRCFSLEMAAARRLTFEKTFIADATKISENSMKFNQTCFYWTAWYNKLAAAVPVGKYQRLMELENEYASANGKMLAVSTSNHVLVQ